METQENYNTNNCNHRHYPASNAGKILGGIVIIGVGSVLLLKQLGAAIPAWVFSWEMLLIVIGLFIGAKHAFRTRGWMVPVLIGSVFLIDDIIPGASITPFLWPIILIAIGAFMIFSPKRRFGKHRWEKWKQHQTQYEAYADSAPEDRLESVSVFGGVKKNVISKNFKGGEIVCIFGGAEVNFTQANIDGRVILDVTNVFGGTKLIVPSNWEIQSEVVAILGGVDDKRQLQPNGTTDQNKVLILRGAAVFGGLEIKSY